MSALLSSASAGADGTSATRPWSKPSEPESIQFVYDAPAECPTEEEFVARTVDLGDAFNADPLGDSSGFDHAAVADVPSRKFTVSIEKGARGFAGKLVVRDLVGNESERSALDAGCDRVARALALFVALALEEAPALAPSPATRSIAPTSDVAPVKARRPRSTAGGIAASAFLSDSGGNLSRGAHVFAALHVFGPTRVGLAAAGSPSRINDTSATGHAIARGFTAHAGALIGWGAPWNDTVAGFVAEAGVLGGQLHGTLERPSRSGSPTTWFFVAPYVAPSLILQLPLPFSIRPFAGLSTLFTANYRGDFDVILTGELGLAWRAW